MKNCARSLIALFALGAIAYAADPVTIAELKQAFQHPPDEARMMVRWWWFGPSVKKEELEREMRSMKAGGIGGFEVQATYPLEVEGNYPYLSPEYLEALRFTGEKAKELGLRMDLTLGSGWPYGGPHIFVGRRVRKVARCRDSGNLEEGEKLVAQIPRDGKTLYFIAGHTRQKVKRPAVGRGRVRAGSLYRCRRSRSISRR